MPRRNAAGSGRIPIGFDGMDGIVSHMDVRTSAPRSRTRNSFRRRRRRADRAYGWPGWPRTAEQLVRFWPVIQNMVVRRATGPLSAVDPGLFLDAAQPTLDDGDLCHGCSRILIKEIENYPLFLFAGMVPWSFLSSSLNESAVCIIVNEGLIRKIYLPKLVFPLARVLIGLVTFVFSLAALCSCCCGRWVPGSSWSMLLLPVVIVLVGSVHCWASA